MADVSREEFDELVRQMGDEIKPFPKSQIGGYLSHFLFVLQLQDKSKRAIHITSPLAAQSVSWSKPFIYKGPRAKHVVEVPVPKNSALPCQLSEKDFIVRPEEFFEVGKETLWLQILNLDARMDSEIGPIRIILGETVKREYPDLFYPSLGVAQSLGKSGFPARLFFDPFAIIETSLGAFRAIHGILSYGRVTNFPPIGTPISIREPIPLDHVDEIRQKRLGLNHSPNPPALIIALAHPIDTELQLPGEEAYRFVERAIENARQA